MVNSYESWKNAKLLPKLKKLIKDNNVSRESMILFLNQQGEKVLTKESTDNIIKRINAGYDIEYFKQHLKKGVKKTLKPKKHFRAYFGAHQTLKINPMKAHLYSFPKFFQDCKKELETLLTEKIRTMKGIKLKFSYLGNMYLATDMDQILHEKNFRSEVHEMINNENINSSIDSAINELETEIEDFIQFKSGWVFHSNVTLHVNLFKYQPIKGSSYIELPTVIANKKACINIQNDDERCFLYCVVAHDHPENKNAFRPKPYEKHFDDYKEWKHEYPMTIKMIPKFEKQFNKSINVYRYETSFDSETKKHKVAFNPLYVTSNITKPDQWINLLLITEGAKHHYVLIKSMSALLHDNYNSKGDHNATHLCPFCFKTYRTMDLLTAHFDNGCKRFGEKTEFPSVEQAKGHVRFTKMFKMLKKPFVIYADFESLLQECDDKGKYQKHVTCSYAYKVVSSVEKYNKEIVLYRSEDEKIDVAKQFVRSLLKEADNIIHIMKDIVPMNLTNDQQKQFDSAKECYLCGCEIKVDDKKVRDHDHLTGEYRGAAHNACNLNYGTGKLENYKIPVVFHNLKGYDSHFII